MRAFSYPVAFGLRGYPYTALFGSTPPTTFSKDPFPPLAMTRFEVPSPPPKESAPVIEPTSPSVVGMKDETINEINELAQILVSLSTNARVFDGAADLETEDTMGNKSEPDSYASSKTLTGGVRTPVLSPGSDEDEVVDSCHETANPFSVLIRDGAST